MFKVILFFFGILIANLFILKNEFYFLQAPVFTIVLFLLMPMIFLKGIFYFWRYILNILGVESLITTAPFRGQCELASIGA